MSDDSEPADYSDFYYVEPDIYKDIYRSSSLLNFLLQVATVFVNAFHLIILTRKELRSNAIYILMIGLCFSDIVNFTLESYYTAVENEWIDPIYNKGAGVCLRLDYKEVDVAPTISSLIMLISRRFSVYLAVSMALIRSLSVRFPMNAFIQSMSTPKFAFITIISLALTIVLFSTWHMWFIRVMWIPDNLKDQCLALPSRMIAQIYVLALPREIMDILESYGYVDTLLTMIPAVCYPLLTASLLFQLRTIQKKRESMRTSEQDKSSTTKLVLLMTVAFMLSEGLGGLAAFGMYFAPQMAEEYPDLLMKVSLAQYLVMNLKSANGLSHAFICYFMSSLYRESVYRLFWGNRKKMKVIMVEESKTSSSGSLTSRKY